MDKVFKIKIFSYGNFLRYNFGVGKKKRQEALKLFLDVVHNNKDKKDKKEMKLT